MGILGVKRVLRDVGAVRHRLKKGGSGHRHPVFVRALRAGAIHGAQSPHTFLRRCSEIEDGPIQKEAHLISVLAV